MDEDIKKILEENLALTKEVHAMTKKIKGYINFQKFISVIYLVIILTPIVLGIIYLPPLLSSVYNQYKDLLGIQAGVDNPIESLLNGKASSLDLNSIDVNKLPPEFKKMIK